MSFLVQHAPKELDEPLLDFTGVFGDCLFSAGTIERRTAPVQRITDIVREMCAIKADLQLSGSLLSLTHGAAPCMGALRHLRTLVIPPLNIPPELAYVLLPANVLSSVSPVAADKIMAIAEGDASALARMLQRSKGGGTVISAMLAANPDPPLVTEAEVLDTSTRCDNYCLMTAACSVMGRDAAVNQLAQLEEMRDAIGRDAASINSADREGVILEDGMIDGLLPQQRVMVELHMSHVAPEVARTYVCSLAQLVKEHEVHAVFCTCPPGVHAVALISRMDVAMQRSMLGVRRLMFIYERFAAINNIHTSA